MTINEVKKLYENKYADIEIVEVFNKSIGFHTDYIIRAYDENDISGDTVVKQYRLMDEKEYQETLLANSDPRADFENWFDDKNAKILVISINQIIN